MITKVSYRPYASGVNNRQTQPQKVSFKAADPQKVGEVLANRLGNLTSAGSRGTIVQDVIATLTFLKEHCGLSEEMYQASVKQASKFKVRTLVERIFGL